MIYTHGPRYRATFQPKQADSLRPALRVAVGHTVILRYCWTSDSGAYAGQACFREDREEWLNGYWVPFEDLRLLELVR